MDPIEDFDHSSCSGRNLPTCMRDASHGHSVFFVGMRGVVTGEDRILFLCKQCAGIHLLSRSLGPMAALLGAVTDFDTDFELAIPYERAEQVLLDVIAKYPDDDSPKRLLDEMRTAKAMVDTTAPDTTDDRVEIVQPMSTNDFARLMARSPTAYPSREDIN